MNRKITSMIILCAMVLTMCNVGLIKAEDQQYSLAVYTTTTAFYQSAANLEQETQSVYFAISKNGHDYQVLNNNGGVVFAKKGTGRIVRPRISRENGKFVIRALDNNGSNVHVFTSDDGVVYEEQDMSGNTGLITDNGVLNAADVTGFPNDRGLSLGNSVEISKEEYTYINDKLGRVINVGIKPVKEFSIKVGETITEEDLADQIPTVDATYSDGSTQEFKTDWTGALAGVDLSAPGTYDIKGKVIQKRYLNLLKELNNSTLPEDNPDYEDEDFPTNYDPETNTVYYDETKFVEGMADPEIFWDEVTGYYYMTGSYFPQDGDAIDSTDRTQQYDRVTLRRGRTLEELQTRQGNQVTVWKVGNQKWYDGPNDKTGGNGYINIWAPEIHRVGYVDEDDPGWWVVYFTESQSTNSFNIFCHCLVLPGDEDPYATGLTSGTQASKWTDYKMQIAPNDNSQPIGGRSIKPFVASFCLDMTYFKDEENGQSYVIWASTCAGNSDLYIAKVSEEEPWQLTSSCIRLTTPEYGWEKIRYQVNEGPTVLQKDGKIFMCFSNSGTGSEYSIGMMTADCGDDLLNISNWTKNPFPVLTSRDVNGEEGPGHNSFTVDEDGNVIFVYHARPTTHNYRMCGFDEATGRSTYNSEPLADPCRHARLKRVHWAADGTPILKMTYDDELTEENYYVTTRITVLTEGSETPSDVNNGNTGNTNVNNPVNTQTGTGLNTVNVSDGNNVAAGTAAKASVKISGKTKIKAGKKAAYKVKLTGVSSGKVKWTVKKGKKLIKLSKKTGKKITVTAKKTGKAVIKVSCGKVSATKKITITK